MVWGRTFCASVHKHLSPVTWQEPIKTILYLEVSNLLVADLIRRKGKVIDITLNLSVRKCEEKERAYRLKVTKQIVEATQLVLCFLAHSPRESGSRYVSAPEVTIEDAPWLYRGMHLDVSRHFYTKEFVKKQIDALVC